MSSNGREILVVPRETLFSGNKYFEKGFVSVEEYDFGRVINENFRYLSRNPELENNPSFKQIIPYVWIYNPQEKKFLIYRREKRQKENREFVEKRLHGKWSCGLGGHIDKGDDESNIIYDAMMRELKEEVFMEKYPSPRIVGYFNDDTKSKEKGKVLVGEVHFGVLAIAETTYAVLRQKEDEVTEEKFLSASELEDFLTSEGDNVETWTQVTWPAVKNYVLRKN